MVTSRVFQQAVIYKILISAVCLLVQWFHPLPSYGPHRKALRKHCVGAECDSCCRAISVWSQPRGRGITPSLITELIYSKAFFNLKCRPKILFHSHFGGTTVRRYTVRCDVQSYNLLPHYPQDKECHLLWLRCSCSEASLVRKLPVV